MDKLRLIWCTAEKKITAAYLFRAPARPRHLLLRIHRWGQVPPRLRGVLFPVSSELGRPWGWEAQVEVAAQVEVVARQGVQWDLAQEVCEAEGSQCCSHLPQPLEGD
jgi:hypothetical protein